MKKFRGIIFLGGVCLLYLALPRPIAKRVDFYFDQLFVHWWKKDRQSHSVDVNDPDYLKKRSLMHQELLQEVYRVVFLSKKIKKIEFGNWVDSLNQGASIEGVYNGLTHSSRYRELEKNNPGATARALSIFGRELALLQKDRPEISHFSTSDALPLSEPAEVEYVEGTHVPQLEEQPVKKELDVERLADNYSKHFVGASIYTLKRILGDEVLKVIEEKEKSNQELSLWYSQWQKHFSEYKIDYGLPLRNKSDEAFHFGWARSVSSDRIRWESLNRVHRTLNYFNKE
ncbi:MAG: hypothetical protein CL678_14945 [Bdellovibrionaceae bacterium]|nr:hypothetical protein [Pseudobdellovibrionaceae bacterium]|tara:strand:+ start:8275 stop:9132 length:858 start_codon:yes stop_codon:yes gene_type:complete